jgi:biopolymer transport protein ExbB
MANVKKESSSNGGDVFSGIVIVSCILVGWLTWKFVMGAGANFQGGISGGTPLQGNYRAMVYNGGPIVPVLMGLLLMVVVFGIERYMVISKAAGKGNLDAFMKKVQGSVTSGDIDGAIDACDKQKGSVANTIKAGLVKYQAVKAEGFSSEDATETIHKEIEEVTALEMPMLEKNLTIISTLVSLGTLAGLLGTVTGMIKAFAGLAGGGGADSAELANGISEALINTATGISTSALAIIVYNFFTSKIDTLTYSIDEAANTIVNTYRRFKGSVK